jgi:hypothetical protein
MSVVRPESKPEPKPELLSTPIHKNPEIVKPVSPQISQISKSPNPVQSPQAPKLTESAIALPQESLSTTSVITTKTEEMKEYAREVTSPEAPSATIVTSSTPVVNVSPRAKEVSPPGLKPKAGPTTRRLKQDTPVVMPNTGAGLERVGVQFGSLSISNNNNNNVEESSETEPQIVPPQVKAEERSSVSVETSPQPQTTPIQQQQQIVPQQSVQQLQQVSQQQVAQQTTQQLQQQTAQLQQQLQPPQSSQPQSTLSQSNSINRLPTTSAQALPSSVSSAPTGTLANAPNQNFNPSNPSYFKQQQDQSSYLNQQQHHLGLTEPLSAPYASYLPNQPPNQLSGFGIGPIPEYNTMYPDAQRMMVCDDIKIICHCSIFFIYMSIIVGIL